MMQAYAIFSDKYQAVVLLFGCSFLIFSLVLFFVDFA